MRHKVIKNSSKIITDYAYSTVWNVNSFTTLKISINDAENFSLKLVNKSKLIETKNWM